MSLKLVDYVIESSQEITTGDNYAVASQFSSQSHRQMVVAIINHGANGVHYKIEITNDVSDNNSWRPVVVETVLAASGTITIERSCLAKYTRISLKSQNAEQPSDVSLFRRLL